MNSSSVYRVVQATQPGKLELAERPLVAPASSEVRIKVDACGVCHSDAATVEGLLNSHWPRVPGHELVGTIDAVGEGVHAWKVGDRVGVGFLGGSCGQCRFCRRGDLVNCENQEITGVHRDGGYAEYTYARPSGLVSVPDDLNSVAAAPLLCAGLTTFSALRNSSVKAGELVAMIGIGGLGHLAVQYANRMGYEVVAIARGAEREALARKLGAHHYIDSASTNVSDALTALGGASLIVATASSGDLVSQSIKGLAPNGKAIVLGATAEPITVASSDLLFGSRIVQGALTGDPDTADATLRFSRLTGVEAMIETIPLDQAVAAYRKMMDGKAHLRVVLTM